jgi:acyl carrier protein
MDEALLTVFQEALQLEALPDPSELKYNEYPGWDSVGHMTLVAAIEDRFGIMMETDDILDMSDFAKAKEIVTRHGASV